MKNRFIQVTSTDVLLDNGMLITWQGFRPAISNQRTPTVFFTTLPGSDAESTAVSMEEIGAQCPDNPVEVTLLNGKATLGDSPLRIDRPVVLPRAGGDGSAQLVFTTETCTIKVGPKPSSVETSTEPVGLLRRSSGGGANGPPPPFPGGGNSPNGTSHSIG